MYSRWATVLVCVIVVPDYLAAQVKPSFTHVGAVHIPFVRHHAVDTLELVFSPSGKYLATGGGLVRIRGLADLGQIAAAGFSMRHIVFVTDDQVLVFGGECQLASVKGDGPKDAELVPHGTEGQSGTAYDVRRGDALPEALRLQTATLANRSPDGRRILLARNQQVELVTVADWKVVATTPLPWVSEVYFVDGGKLALLVAGSKLYTWDFESLVPTPLTDLPDPPPGQKFVGTGQGPRI